MPYKFKIAILISVMFSLPVSAQIYSPDEHASDTVAYVMADKTDSVFIFNVPEPGGNLIASIAADSPDSLGGWTFRWYIYNPATFTYDLIGTASGSGTSIDTLTSFAGYRLIMNKGAEGDTSRVWVLFNDYSVTITSKDAEGHLPQSPVFVNCKTIKLVSALDAADLYYHIPGMDSSIAIVPVYSVTWTKDTEAGSLPQRRTGDAYVNDPPYEDTWYTLTLRDNFGLRRNDSVFFESIQPKAATSYNYIPLSDTKYYPEVYSYYYSWDNNTSPEVLGYPAPAKFLFTNSESKNAYRFIWHFGDDSVASSLTPDDTILHQYYFPGIYTVQMVAFGPLPNECADTLTLDEKITLSNSFIGESDSLKFPNVFTPNSDGFNTMFQAGYEDVLKNDFFRPYDVSIYDFSIVIFNRYGKKVHEYSGDIRNWKGWDGKILNTDKDATEGVYYYVVDMVVGFELNNKGELSVKKFDKKQQTGFVHLFREPK